MAIQAEVLEAQVRITGLEAAVRDLKRLDSKTTGTAKNTVSAGKNMRNAFAGVATGAAVLSIGKFLKGTADDASDLNETMSMSTAIFGKNQKSIDRWATNAWKKVGLGKQAAMDAAASFGDMFLQIGFGGKEATKMSKAVVQMSADLGSFKNLKTSEVTEMMSAAFRGEYDSLQRVIPNINAARVEHEALLKTHKKSAKELTAQEKAAATLAIVQKDGARAQGDFAKTSGGAANQQKILQAQIENTKAKIGQSLLPAYRNFWKFSNDKVVPGINDFIDGMKSGEGAGGKFASMFKNQVVPAAKDLVNVGKDMLPFLEGAASATHTLVTAFSDLPKPLRQNLLLLGGLTLAMSKLTNSKAAGGLSAFSTELSTVEGRSAKARAGLQALGGVARNVAGAGGMLLLANSTKAASKEVGAMEGALGGALTGGALGSIAGPWGAAAGAVIGGVAGGLNGLAKAGRNAGDGVDEARAPLDSYINTLKNARRQITGMTRDQAIANLRGDAVDGGPSTFQAAQNLGISTRSVTKAALGDLDSMKAINKRIGEVIASQGVTGNTLKLMAGLGLNQRQLKADIQAFNEAKIAAGKYSKILPDIPKNVVTRIDTLGLAQTEAKIVGLQRKYKLTPKQVETILKATGTSEGDIKAILARMKDQASGGVPVPVKPVSYNAKGVLAGFIRGLQATANANPIRVPTKPGGSMYGGTIVKGMAGGGMVPGSRQPYGDKVLRMLAPGEEVIPNGNGEADRFRSLRNAGMIPGMAKGGTVKPKGPTKAQKAARDLFGDLKGMGLKDAMEAGLGSTRRLLERMEKLVRKRTSGAQEKRLEKILTKQGARLERATAKRDAIDKRLTAATAKRDAIVQARDDFRSNVQSGISSQANVLNSGNNASDIAKNLTTQAGKAKEFAKAIQDLRKRGYSSAVIQQVAGAGIESGLEIAKALASASTADKNTINQSFASINATAAQQGKLLADQFYGAGIASAQGVVKGLKSEKHEIEKAMESIARGMIKALRKALGIKSPARKPRAEMRHVGRGMALGLLDEINTVSKASSTLAGAVMGGISSTSTNLTPAAMGMKAKAGGVNLTFITHNPIAEPQSQTTNKGLARVAALGLVG